MFLSKLLFFELDNACYDDDLRLSQLRRRLRPRRPRQHERRELRICVDADADADGCRCRAPRPGQGQPRVVRVVLRQGRASFAFFFGVSWRAQRQVPVGGEQAR